MSRKQDFTLVELVIVIACFIGLVLVFNGCGKSEEKDATDATAALINRPLMRARESAHRSNCRGNLNQIGKALRMYAIDFDGKYPCGPAYGGTENDVLEYKDFYTAKGRAGGFEILRVNGYLCDYDVYVCPSTAVTAGKGNESLSWSNAGSGSGKANCSYAYLPGLVDGDNARTGRAGSGICADLTGDKGVDSNGGAANHTKYGNILFLDGHVNGFEGLGWFSPDNVGLPKYRDFGSRGAMVPNTLRDPATGEVL